MMIETKFWAPVLDKGGTSVDFVGSLRNLYYLNVRAQLKQFRRSK